ncbi:MauE/DoxX family redox-associated membrane protein [Streptomyces sp. NPDC088147]|uniref:MauE/DoxX family redox-associated membrane protein n=1 Tax=unclassified Streptomyces TaxID=2593676 RepID=UPI0033B1489C
METVAAACAVCLVVVFAAAAVGKLRGAGSFPAFVRTLKDLGVIPERWARGCALLLVAGEISVAVLLLTAPLAPGLGTAGFILAAGLLAAFTAGIAITAARRTGVRCRCFGASASPLGARHAARNAALALIAVTGAALAPAIARVQPAEALLAVCAGTLAGALAIVWDDIVGLFRPVSH